MQGQTYIKLNVSGLKDEKKRSLHSGLVNAQNEGLQRSNLDHVDYPESYECLESSFIQGSFAAVAPAVEGDYLASLDGVVQQSAVCYLDENVIPISNLSVALVRTRTIPTERPPPVGEVSANFCG